MLKSILFLMLAAQAATAATWYVRTDGGTATQCTGTTDAQYPGSGSAQPCGFKNPYYLWTNDPAHNLGATAPVWKIASGDTVIIKDGDYRMGYQSNDTNGWWNYTGCRGNNRNCYNPPIPAGTSLAHTKIYGENHGTGCATRPVLYGAAGVDAVLNLRDTSYVDITCVEITDHAQCRIQTLTGEPYPCGTFVTEHAYNGMITNAGTHHIWLDYVNIHGLASTGINGLIGGNVSADHFRISAVGNIGWQFDAGGVTSTGPFTIDHWLIEWTACVEQYPIVASLPIMGCYDQSGANANGDAFGFIDMTDDITIRNGISRYNMQDGLDALYIKSGNNLTVENNSFYDNEGQQIKTGGAVNMNVRNNLIRSGCKRMMEDFTGMPNPGLWNAYLKSPCRASDGIALILKYNSVMNFENNSLTMVNGTLINLGCRTILDTWDSNGRTDWAGTLVPEEALNGTSRTLTTAYPIYGITENGALVRCPAHNCSTATKVNQRVGKTWFSGTQNASNRYPISSINTSTDVITGVAAIAVNTRLRVWTESSLPAPLVQDTYYYVVSPSGNTFKLAATQGGAAIDLTTAGTGTIYTDLDCSAGIKCGWYYLDNTITADVTTATPLTTDTFTLTYYGTGHCDTAVFNFNNNLVHGVKRESSYVWPTVWWVYNTEVPAAASNRHNNKYCGINPTAAPFNTPSATETWDAQTCTGDWFTAEPPIVLVNQADMDVLDMRLPETSPAIDAGRTISGLTTDFAGTARPQFNAYDIGAYEYSVIVTAPLTIVTESPLSVGVVGTPYSSLLTASGGVTPYTWTLFSGSLCSGLSLSTAGLVSGTPTAAQTCNFTVKVTDTAGITETKALAITVSAATTNCAVTTASLPVGVVGVAYSKALTVSGCNGTVVFAILNGLPDGLSLDGSTGVISGTPTTPGEVDSTLYATDSIADSPSVTLPLVIQNRIKAAVSGTTTVRGKAVIH